MAMKCKFYNAKIHENCLNYSCLYINMYFQNGELFIYDKCCTCCKTFYQG